MKLNWNGELKKLVAVLAVLSAIGFAAGNYILWVSIDDVRSEYNRQLAIIFGNMAEMYPEVGQEEYIRVLNGEENLASGRKVLARYGVLEESGSGSFAAFEGKLTILWRGVNIFFFILTAAVVLVVLDYIRRRQNKIARLESYMEAVDRGTQGFETTENEDDELSRLRNEIFRLVVLLREQAGRALAQRHALADSVANISHQLKTPLTSLTVLADNLSESSQLDDMTRQRFLSEITRQLAGMSWLVTAMLKLSRFDAGVVELKEENICVEGLVEEILSRLEVAAEWKNIIFVRRFTGKERLTVDRKWTAEALMNIIKNAVEHSPQEGIVEIACEENDVYTQIDIRDHGVGITQEEREKLFDRFYNKGSVREDSVGIGLSLAKEIVEKQGGMILVDSKEGTGTVFQLRFLKKIKDKSS